MTLDWYSDMSLWRALVFAAKMSMPFLDCWLNVNLILQCPSPCQGSHDLIQHKHQCSLILTSKSSLSTNSICCHHDPHHHSSVQLEAQCKAILTYLRKWLTHGRALVVVLMEPPATIVTTSLPKPQWKVSDCWLEVIKPFRHPLARVPDLKATVIGGNVRLQHAGGRPLFQPNLFMSVGNFSKT